jgi:hypothetical protein
MSRGATGATGPVGHAGYTGVDFVGPVGVTGATGATDATGPAGTAEMRALKYEPMPRLNDGMHTESNLAHVAHYTHVTSLDSGDLRITRQNPPQPPAVLDAVVVLLAIYGLVHTGTLAIRHAIELLQHVIHVLLRFT